MKTISRGFESCYPHMVASIITVIVCLLSVAFFTIAERKLLASIQRRKGPNVVGF